MHFKMLPWEFTNKNKYIVKLDEMGFYALHCSDPYIEKIFLDMLPTNLKTQGLQVLQADELTHEWYENNFENLSLFGNQESYLILQAENTRSSIQQLLINQINCFDGRYLILSFSKKSNFFDRIKSSKKGTFYTILMPRFWESLKLLTWLEKWLQMKLDPTIKQYIIGAVPNTCADFINCLQIIKLHFPDNNVNFQKVKELIAPYKLDQFHLANLYSKKEKKLFFLSLLQSQINQDAWHLFFLFMQGHLFRMLDPEYITKKAKASKYDQTIVAHSKNWKKSELSNEIRFFANLELMAKRRDPFLKEKIRRAYLEQL
ncbi:MAG: hypothetical protein ISR65_13680 [Bacteriovoracaceae bacterium]|nr:hypothetical protein [Bacteriovoracaceae bacterium]